MEWLTDEMIFFGGIAVAAVSAVLTLIYTLFSHRGKKRLNAKLDAEYGEIVKGKK